MKIQRLQRILRLITILQSDRYYSPTQLAEKLSVTRRTIFRDLDMLRKAGIPYFHDEGEGGYKIDASFYLPPLNLTLLESLSLLLLTQHTATNQGLPLQQDALQAAMKIEAALPPHIRRYCSQVFKTTSARFNPKAYHEGAGSHFALFRKAIQEKRKVQLEYDSFYEKQIINTILSPYHLHFSRRAWYIIGHSSLHDETRTFKLARIQSAQLQDQRYLLDKPFDIECYLGQAWSIIPEGKTYHVKLRFLPMVAGNVAEVLWHPSQKLAWQQDGSLLFEAQIDGLNEIAWWIMGYADQVQVLAPSALQKKILQMTQNIVTLYRSV